MSNISDFEINKGVLKKYIGSDEDVVIPDGVSSISDGAFCAVWKLKSVTITDGVQRIGKSAFGSCEKLTEITFPKSVSKICNNAFSCCRSLQKIIILGRRVEFETYAFYNCKQSKIIATEVPLYLFPDTDSKLMAVNGFLSDMSLYENEKIYNDYCTYLIAQRKRLLGEFFKADNVAAIAFYCDHKKVTAKNINEEYLVSAQKNKSKECFAYLLEWKRNNISKDAVKKNTEREQKKDPFNVDDMKKLWKYKEQDDGTLMLTEYKGNEKHITVPDRIGKKPVTRLDYYLFATSHYMGERIPADREKVMASIQSVEIPDSITSIGGWVFRGCKGLKDENGYVVVRGVLYDYFGCESDIKLPDNVEIIDSDVFAGKCYLQSLTIPENVKEVGVGAFRGCAELERLAICDGVKKILPQAFSFCEKLTEFTIPGSVDEIASEAFSFCEKLASVTVKNGVKIIGKEVFCKCLKLKSVSLPESLTEIKERAFSGCESLTDINIPGGIKTIEYGVFDGCSSLEKLILPDGVELIDFRAFCDCIMLKELHIPSSVTNIEDFVFTGCEKLVIYTPAGSYAEQYAKEHNIKFCAV